MIIVFCRELLREILIKAVRMVYAMYGYDIASGAKISLGAKLDKTNPKGIHIGEETYIASGAIVFTHDFSRGLHGDTYIGKRCFIGANAIIMCGVRIPDMTVVGAGAVVTKSPAEGGGNYSRQPRTCYKTRYHHHKIWSYSTARMTHSLNI